MNNSKIYIDRYPHNWFDDYPTEPFGGTNPYYRCVYCKRGVPSINYRLEGHAEDCEYRISKQIKLLSITNNKKSKAIIKTIKFKPYPHEIMDIPKNKS